MDRRHFLGTMAGAGAAAVLYDGANPAPASAQEVIKASGTDMSGWRTVLGDGLYTGPGQTPPTIEDIGSVHHGSHTTLHANVHERGVMAHNITFERFTLEEGISSKNRAETWFRIPKVPTDGDWTYNCQTLEIGMFIWDGPDTRNDYGLAIQWVLNPWIPEFGQIRAWRMVNGSPEWVSVDYLEPDTEWHKFGCLYRPGERAAVRLDGRNRVKVDETVTPKDPTWGTTVDARFQVEIVSVWPGVNPSVPPHAAEFKDWRWWIVTDD